MTSQSYLKISLRRFSPQEMVRVSCRQAPTRRVASVLFTAAEWLPTLPFSLFPFGLHLGPPQPPQRGESGSAWPPLTLPHKVLPQPAVLLSRGRQTQALGCRVGPPSPAMSRPCSK